MFEESKVVFVYSHIDNRDGETKIVADTVEEVLLILKLNIVYN